MRAANFSKMVVLLVLLLMATAVAQKSNGPKYDLTAESTLKGVVDEVKEVPNSCMGDTGVHLFLTTDAGKIEVQIGPAFFLKDMDVTFAKGDRVEIIASKTLTGSNTLYLARQVTKQNNELVVRDKKGEPVWMWMKKG